MIARTFVNTNVLLYAHDADAGGKASASLRGFTYTVAGRQWVPEHTRNYGTWAHTATTTETVLRATGIGEVYQLSFWDSLILAAAEQDGASVVLSEDLNNGQIIAGLRVVNPFEVRTG